MKYECLKLEERRIIEDMYARGAKPGEIAERVGKCQATIYRELERGKTGETDSRFRQGYSAAALAERGELLQRRLGYDAGAIPEKDDFLLMVRPFEIVTLKRAIMTAIELGYGREVTSPGGDEIDEGLAELNQKKTR